MSRPTHLHTPQNHQYIMLWNMLLLFIRKPKIKNAILYSKHNNTTKKNYT